MVWCDGRLRGAMGGGVVGGGKWCGVVGDGALKAMWCGVLGDGDVESDVAGGVVGNSTGKRSSSDRRW